MHEAVHVTQEVDRLEVFAATKLVGHPLAFAPRVIEVQHRGHGVHTQPIDVVTLQPGQSRRRKEAAHLVAAIVENERAPIHVRTLPRIGVLIQVRPVELG